MVIRLGMIGYNEGNGHPFSFAAIVNGFDEAAMREAGWGVIADYLAPRSAGELGIPGVEVSHVWAPDPEIAEQIRRASRVPHRVNEVGELIGRVDAVMIARDDWQEHERLAKPFLDAGLPTFVDKPLTLDESELRRFEPYLDRGLLASWSGLRFAPELDALLELPEPPDRIQGSGPLHWDTYAIHLLEPALRLSRRSPVAVVPRAGAHESVTVELAGGGRIDVDVLGDPSTPFTLTVPSAEGTVRVDLRDRFTSFKRAIEHFVCTIEAGRPVVPPEATLAVVRTLIAGRECLASGRRVTLATKAA